MVLPPKVIHPKGDAEPSLKKREISALIADTFDPKFGCSTTKNTKDTNIINSLSGFLPTPFG
jgi:hypothetical protein